MEKELFTFIVGGKAGEGVRKAGSVASQIFVNKERDVFQMDDYMSLIRGGHNFSVVSTRKNTIYSQYLSADLIVNFDERSYKNHISHLADGGIIVYNSDEIDGDIGIGVPLTSEAKKFASKTLLYGVGAVAILACSIGTSKNDLNELIKQEYPSGINDNLAYSNKIYDLVYPNLWNKFNIEKGTKKKPLLYGNYAIALGALAGGLDVYYGYPMTPSSSILHYLAALAEKFGLAVVHPESEIAVINMAIGSAYTGARTMVGTSGGGFALMTEGISLAGMVEAPILCVLSTRPAPATGVPTYTEQGDLYFALNAGHGEFLRIVASPGTIEEAYYLAAELLDLAWKFQTPSILLTDMHLSDSAMTIDLDLDKTKWSEPEVSKESTYKRYVDTETGISPMLFPPSKVVVRWNSHEHDEFGITTEEPTAVSLMHNKRIKKIQAIKNILRNRKTINVYGDKGLIIFTYGSSTMSVLEAINYGQIEAVVIQPIYLNPLPVWELEKYKNKKAIVVEQSSIGQFSNLLKEQAGLSFEKVIKQYNGRPFDPIELSNKIREVL